MSDIFLRLFADAEVRQNSLNQTPNLPQGRKKKRKCMQRAVFRIVNILEVLLHVTVYGTILWMAFVTLVCFALSIILTSPIWIPCIIICMPVVAVIAILCKFTSIPSRSANSVKESNLVKKISWNSIFGIAKT